MSSFVRKVGRQMLKNQGYGSRMLHMLSGRLRISVKAWGLGKMPGWPRRRGESRRTT